LELERKKQLNLRLLLRETERELGDLKQAVAKKRRESQESHARVQSAKEKTAAAKAEICNKKTNERVGEVNEIKLKIDALRKERTQFLKIFKVMEEEMALMEEATQAAADTAGKAR
jgi:hypothetical protein